MAELVFLKLGGSLITDKTRPYTPRLEKLNDLASQIAEAMQSNPGLSIVLGHGSGSFGHTAAKKYHTREGLTLHSDNSPNNYQQQTESYWKGFSQVWFQASKLNRFVMEALQKVNIACLGLAPVSAISAQKGSVSQWNMSPLKAALSAKLVPVIYGDVIFDETMGGTILSTEDLFEHLAQVLKPERILLAGLEGAVWADFPVRKLRIEKITPVSYKDIETSMGASHGTDVTGGMESKVRQMLKVVSKNPGMTAQIFSGEEPGNVLRTLAGESLGTILAAE